MEAFLPFVDIVKVDLPLEASIKAAIAQRDGELGQLIDSAERWERAGENAPPSAPTDDIRKP